jgi:hypothetical protein
MKEVLFTAVCNEVDLNVTILHRLFEKIKDYTEHMNNNNNNDNNTENHNNETVMYRANKLKKHKKPPTNEYSDLHNLLPNL